MGRYINDCIDIPCNIYTKVIEYSIDKLLYHSDVVVYYWFIHIYMSETLISCVYSYNIDRLFYN